MKNQEKGLSVPVFTFQDKENNPKEKAKKPRKHKRHHKKDKINESSR